MTPAHAAYCCEMMRADLTRLCSIHARREDCPDALIAVFGDSYGLYVHDGGSSVIAISFCPWCGQRLPATDDLPE